MYAITILLSWQHNDYTWHFTYHIWDHSHCICVITQMVNTSVAMYRSIDDISTSVYISTIGTHMTSYPIYITSHSHFMTSMIMFFDLTNTAFMTSDLYMTSLPLFRASHHFLYDIKSTVSDLTSTFSVSSHPFCWCYHTNCISVITSAIIHDMISIVYDMTATVWHQNSCHNSCPHFMTWYHL